jgi:molecular chaperone DnaK (HSP70)
MLCRNCIWEILNQDLFCSWCGKEVFQLVIRDRPIRLYVYAQKAQTYQADIVKNESPVPVMLECVSPPAWLNVTPNKTILEPTRQLKVSLNVDVKKLGGILFQKAQLVFQPSAINAEKGNNFKNIEMEIQIWPAPPEVRILPLTVFTSKSPVKTQLVIDTLAEINIESLKFNPPYLTLNGTPPWKIVENGHTSLPAQLNLPAQVEFKKESLTFQMKIEGLTDVLDGQFDLTIKRSPTLEIPELKAENFATDLIPYTDEDITLTVANKGEEMLIVENIIVRAINPASQTHVVIKPERTGFNVDPDKEVLIRLKASAAADAPTESYFFEIEFQSNDPLTEHNRGNLLVRVINQEFQNFIALDFGTTDSAVAIFEEKQQKPQSVFLEKGGPDDPKIYSNIFFRGYVEANVPPYLWDIGKRAKLLGPTRRDHFIKAIKIKAGKNHTVKLDFKDLAIVRKLPAEEVIKFILMDLLKLTRQALGKKPARLILSVPTRFTLRQKEILQKTCHEAAQALALNLRSLDLIDESLAAGLFYILLRGPKDEYVRYKETYTMMILDFGGGTTDVTVFKVRQKIGPHGNVIRIDEIEVIGAWGDATLGGEEITTKIAELLAERYLGREIDQKADRSVIENLEDEAEAVKLIFSDLPKLLPGHGPEDIERASKKASALFKANLGYILPGGHKVSDERLRQFLEDYAKNEHHLKVRTTDFPGNPETTINEQEVAAIYEQKLLALKAQLNVLRSKIAEQQITASTESGSPFKVDVLLLAGQSSQFPIVQQVFRDFAENIDFVRDAEGEMVLKECVSRGALYYGFRNRIGLKLTGLNRTWNRIGLMGFVIGEGTQFQELIPWGSEYPFESETFWHGEIMGNRLVLSILENLRMDDTPLTEVYKKFELELEGPLQDGYLCKLKMDEKGEIQALCQVEDTWREME